MSDPAASTVLEGLTELLPNLRAFAYSLTRNRDSADDLLQETMIKVWQHRARFAEGSNFKAWVFTILRNTWLSNLRKRKYEVEDADGMHSEKVKVAPAQHGHMDMLDLSAALARLPADQREAVLLVGAEGFSYEDAALMCGCAVGTMKSRVNRARRKLGEAMGVVDASEFATHAAEGMT